MALVVWSNDTAEALKKEVGKAIASAGLVHRVVSFPPLSTDKPFHDLPPCGPGDLVLAMGTLALKTLGAHKVLRKGSSISSQRNQLHTLPTGAKCLVTYAAEVKHTDYSCFVDMQTDVRAAIRYCNTGTLVPKVGTYRYVNDFTDCIKYIKNQFAVTKKPVRVVHDTETLGTDRFAPNAYFVSLQLTVRAGMADVIRFGSREECLKALAKGSPLWKQLEWLFTSDEVTLQFANGKYDNCWHNTLVGLPLPTNFKFDTTIVGSLLDENRSNSLNVHAKLKTDMGGYDDAFNLKWDKARMDLALAGDPEGFLIYAGGDTDAAYQVADQFRSEILRDGRLTNFYVHILHPAARAYEEVEQVGWYVDIPYYEHLKEELEHEISVLEAQMKEIIGGRLVAKHTDEYGVINFTKKSLLVDFMFSPTGLNIKPRFMTPSGKDPSTAYDHLKQYDDDPKAGTFIKIWKEYQSAQRTLQTYVINYDRKTGAVDGGFLAHLRSDGRFHPNYFMYSGYDDWNEDEGGTVTGRLSVKDPAIQTIPQHTIWAKRIRRAFIAPPGMRIVAPDYSQGELRIAACRADDETMIEAYLKGIDLHALTGSRVSGYTWEQFQELKKTDKDLWASIRQRGKPCNFGLLYGQKEEGFMVYAVNKYNVKMTLEEAVVYREGFFNLYDRLLAWHEREVAHARKLGWVRSDLGRIRHVPMIHSADRFMYSRAKRQAINSPIQSCLSDMSLWAAAIMWQKGVTKVCPLFGMVHDQTLQFVPEDNWQHHALVTKEIMENLPFEQVGWKPQLSFPVDIKTGPNLGDLEEWKPEQVKVPEKLAA